MMMAVIPCPSLSALLTKMRQHCPTYAKVSAASRLFPRASGLLGSSVLACPLLPSRGTSLAGRALGAILVTTIFGGFGGCLFTDPINMTPQVNINPPGTVWRGQPVSLTATASDANGDDVTLEWAHYGSVCGTDPVPSSTCKPCPDNSDYLDETNWPPAFVRTPTARYDVDGADTDTPFCVWVFAMDSHGAVRPARPLLVKPENHLPVADIQVTRPSGARASYPLFAEIQLSASQSSDQDSSDQLTFKWKVSAPLGSQVMMLTDCVASASDPVHATQCFTPDVDTSSGSYAIQLTVTDGRGGSSTVTRDIIVAPDRFPCLVSTMPALAAPVLYAASDTPLQFTVNGVADDGDPFPADPLQPANMLTFRWSEWRTADSLSYVSDMTYREHTIPASSYTLGDEVKVRLEIRDRNVDAIEALLRGCGDSDVCGQPEGCYQRFTWTIHYR